MALGADEVGHPQLAGARRRAHHDVGEERAEDHVASLGGELLDHLGAALGIGAVVLEDDLDRAAVDAARSFSTLSAAAAVRSYQRP